MDLGRAVPSPHLGPTSAHVEEHPWSGNSACLALHTDTQQRGCSPDRQSSFCPHWQFSGGWSRPHSCFQVSGGVEE